MSDTSQQSGDGTAGASRNRRRILKGAAAIAPVIVTMRSSNGWAASSCGDVLGEINPDGKVLNQNQDTEIVDLIRDSGRVGYVENGNGTFTISTRCYTSFNPQN
jgi:hypothetical protein